MSRLGNNESDSTLPLPSSLSLMPAHLEEKDLLYLLY